MDNRSHSAVAASTRGPFLARPALRDLRFGLLLCLAFSIFFELTYIATNYVTGLHHFRVHVHSSLELRIRLVPAMAVVYFSLNLLLALTPFVLRTWREIIPLCVVMTVETLICAFFFLVLPVELGYAHTTPTGAWAGFYQWVNTISLKYNNMPSLHVAFAFTVAMAFGSKCGVVGRRLLLAWAGAIAISTIFTHEHHVADVAAGIALALVMQPVYRWSAANSWLEALRLEVLCLWEFRHFVLRHRRYLLTLIVIYKYSLGRWRRTRIIRTGFCLTQHIDDVLDGDRKIDGDPEAYVLGLLRQIAKSDYDQTSFASVLARYVVAELRSCDEEYPGADRNLLRLFDLLLFDYRRRKEHLVLTAEDLREHHRLTFFYSLDLTLIACDAKLRATDAPELIAALAWCSVMRDLEEDMRGGLINIPLSVLELAGKQGAPTLEYRSLVRTSAVRNWIKAEYQRGVAAIEQCERKLTLFESRPGAGIMALFLHAIRIYARKYARKNRDILNAAVAPALQEAREDAAC